MQTLVISIVPYGTGSNKQNMRPGVILHGEIAPEVPFENIEALYSAFDEYRRYPFTWI